MWHNFSEIDIYMAYLSALLKRTEVVFHGLLNVWHLIVLSSIDARACPYKNSQNRWGPQLCHHIPGQKAFEEGRTEQTSTLNEEERRRVVRKHTGLFISDKHIADFDKNPTCGSPTWTSSSTLRWMFSSWSLSRDRSLSCLNGSCSSNIHRKHLETHISIYCCTVIWCMSQHGCVPEMVF